MSLTIELPLPPRALSSNGSHGHWSGHARAEAAYRDECRLWAMAQISPVRRSEPPERAYVAYEVCTKHGRAAAPLTWQQGRRTVSSPRYQPRDQSNALAALKAAQDALVDSGAIKDDSQKHMILAGITISGLEGPYVRVRVTPC